MGAVTNIRLACKVGELVLSLQDKGLSAISIEHNNTLNKLKTFSALKIKSSVITQLESYFSRAIPFKGISLIPAGTDFQKSVWRELSKIPLGETRTYGQIAKKLNSSARAVGNACRRNPIQIIIPCHRVISATGIGGYAGKTNGKQLDTKRWLLAHEGVQID